ncbi:hypothetical protein ABZY32_16500 [Nocardiopsis alba]|uniref:hypothetical protein n=1 Tax=Nocardiopsis alba TaxID=53437 RepID=UPI0033A09CDD
MKGNTSMTRNSTQIITGLRAWADGSSTDRAAVELLITHDVWLHRSDFLDLCVFDAPAAGLTFIDWEPLDHALERRQLPASGSELAVLGIVASLGCGHPVDLRDALLGLDATNTAAVTTAMVTAAQHTDRVTIELAGRQLPDWSMEG